MKTESTETGSDAIRDLVARSLAKGAQRAGLEVRPDTAGRIEKAFALLPEDVAELFLSGAVDLAIRMAANLALPLGMQATVQGSPQAARFEILLYDEHQDLPEDQFIGAFLHQLGVLVARTRSRVEEPAPGPAHAKFKQALECEADVLVWEWGLAYYSLSHLNATYPAHVVDRIVAEIKADCHVDDPDTRTVH
ncbi:MAG: hypothetical protein AB1646_17835 [Thermodesulfobacteriota bacterium]